MLPGQRLNSFDCSRAAALFYLKSPHESSGERDDGPRFANDSRNLQFLPRRSCPGVVRSRCFLVTTLVAGRSPTLRVERSRRSLQSLETRRRNHVALLFAMALLGMYCSRVGRLALEASGQFMIAEMLLEGDAGANRRPSNSRHLVEWPCYDREDISCPHVPLLFISTPAIFSVVIISPGSLRL